MKKILSVPSVLLTGLIFLPLTVFAQTATTVAGGIGSLSDLITLLTTTVVKSLATLLLSLALLAFFWGIVEYIWAKRQGKAEGVKAGSQFMTWGLIALFVMFSVYGIIKLAQNILGMSNVTTIEIPRINFGGSPGPAGTPTTGLPTGGSYQTPTSGIPNGTYYYQDQTVTGGAGLTAGESCSGSDGVQGPCQSGLVCSGDAGNMTCVSSQSAAASSGVDCSSAWSQPACENLGSKCQWDNDQGCLDK